MSKYKSETKIDPVTGSTVTTLFIPADDPIWAGLEEARAEWKRLAEAGTPFWCIHPDVKDGTIDLGEALQSGRAYTKPDGYLRPDGLEIQWSHGVMCRDCGGYIQEG